MLHSVPIFQKISGFTQKREMSSIANTDNAGVANLTVVSYEKLLSNDQDESSRLLSACREWGFFYLDLTSTESASYLRTVNELSGVSKEYFAQPLDYKLKDTREEWSLFNICG
jgi:isopenicillin N synthase-like dioxygenase